MTLRLSLVYSKSLTYLRINEIQLKPFKPQLETVLFQNRLTDKKFASRDDKSPKALEKRGQQGNVTLHDVKCE